MIKAFRKLVKIFYCLCDTPLRYRLKYKAYGRFPIYDHLWVKTACVLYNYIDTKEPIIAPNDFLDVFPRTYPPRMTYALKDLDNITWVVMHMDEIPEFPAEILKQIRSEYHPVYANPVFVILTKNPKVKSIPPNHIHYQSFQKILEKRLNTPQQDIISCPDTISCAVVITTYNRPAALERTLSQLTPVHFPVLVINDGSDSSFRDHYDAISKKYPAEFIHLPQNRGICCGLNTGISYFLADPSIEWISTFNDDVDIDPALFTILAEVQDKDLRPICTGYDIEEHPILNKAVINGRTVFQKTSTSAQHIHAHRDYWTEILPIPTPYLGAPKKEKGIPGQGSDADWWITSWSPKSAVKNGMYITCVPGLVKTFAVNPDESTWDGGQRLSKS